MEDTVRGRVVPFTSASTSTKVPALVRLLYTLRDLGFSPELDSALDGLNYLTVPISGSEYCNVTLTEEPGCPGLYAVLYQDDHGSIHTLIHHALLAAAKAVAVQRLMLYTRR